MFLNKQNANFATLSPEVPLINVRAFMLFEKLVQIKSWTRLCLIHSTFEISQLLQGKQFIDG